MEILTSQDRAMVSACCPCELPQCAAPRTECQSLTGRGRVAWEIWQYSTETYFQTTRSNYSDGGFRQHRMSQPFSAWFDSLPGGAVSMATEEFTEGEPRTGLIEIEHLEPIDVDAARSAAFDALAAGLDWENEEFTYGSDCASSRNDHVPYAQSDTLVGATWARYRLGVPEDFSTGDAPRSYYEVEWDEVEASEEWWEWFDNGMQGDPPEEGPSLKESRHWLWGGSVEEPWSDWFELPPPGASEKVIRVANIMVKCWKSARLGVVPTAHGDVIELG